MKTIGNFDNSKMSKVPTATLPFNTHTLSTQGDSLWTLDATL